MVVATLCISCSDPFSAAAQNPTLSDLIGGICSVTLGEVSQLSYQLLGNQKSCNTSTTHKLALAALNTSQAIDMSLHQFRHECPLDLSQKNCRLCRR